MKRLILSMDKDFESVYHTVEDTHWWFKARQEFVCRFLRKQKIPSHSTILDIGCSGGGMIRALQQRGYHNIHGIDISPDAITYCQKKGLTNIILGDAQGPLQFQDNNFDVIIASDILEHVENPDKALAEWKRLLKDKGMSIIFVPAFKWMWSERDTVSQHKRRYTKNSLTKAINNNNLNIILMSYWNFFLLIPYIFIILLKKRTKNKIVQMKNTNSLTNKALKILLSIENTIILSGARLPFGISLVTVVQKHE